MFSFSRCIGRRQKSSPQQSDPAEAPVPGFDHSDSDSAIPETEPKKLDNFECTTTSTPICPKSTGKKSYCSSVLSRSSASFNQLYSGLGSVESTQGVNGCRLSTDLGLPTAQTKKMLSVNLQIKCTEFSQDRSLTIHEEGEGPPPSAHSYSDDPFAPPTPRAATFTPSSCRDSGTETTRASALTCRARQLDVKSNDYAILIPHVQPHIQLPTIARVSKLSFGDWILESPKQSPVSHSRSRLPSTTRRLTLTSPVPTYRTSMGTNAVNSPRTPNTICSSKTQGTNQVPFPEYP